MNWPRRHLKPIGIDFGSCAIRMLQVRPQNDKASIVASGQFVYPADCVDEESRRQATIAAVREMLAPRGFVGRRVVTALPDRDVQVKNLRLPAIPAEELASAVRYEAAERFGFDDAETELRHLIAGNVPGGGRAQQEIVVLAVARHALRRHLELISELGLIAEAVDIVPCALFRPFEQFLRRGADAGEVNAFVDLGCVGTRIVVARGREIIFLKPLEIGAAQFDLLVADRLSVSLPEARALRRRIAAAGEDQAGARDEPVPARMGEQVRQATRPAVEQLGKEIGLCLRYCAVTFRGPRCDSVTCVGGEAHNADLLEQLGDILGIPARKGYPLRYAECDAAFALAEQCTGQAEWATAFGLALRPSAAEAARMAG